MFYQWMSDKKADEAIKNQPQISITSNTPDDKTNADQNITVESDLYSIDINLKGGDIVRVDLKDQYQKIGSKELFHLMYSNDSYKYLARSDLATQTENSGITSILRPVFTSEYKNYSMTKIPEENDTNKNSIHKYCAKYREDLANGKTTAGSLDSISIPLHAVTSDGINITKTYIFKRCFHSVEVKYEISSVPQPLNLYVNSSLIQSEENPEVKSSMFATSAYRGMAYSTADTKYEKETFSSIASQTSRENYKSDKGGWVSMIQHYFVSAWIGLANQPNTIFTESADNKKTAIAGIQSAAIIVKPGETAQISNILWMGPKDINEMETASPHLDLTVDYGWLSFLSVWLYYALDFIHSIVFNWGIAIIILTLIVRGCMYPLTKKQYTSMARMKMLSPQLTALKEKYKDVKDPQEKQKMTLEMMDIYKREGVNPLGGCFPVLIQMPIFIALYWTLLESTALRHSEFFLWIKDLSASDPYYVLPVLMGITMLIIQKISPQQIQDPLQRKIFLLMPIIFTLMFCNFPAGLTLYWVVSNTVTLVQQLLIFRALSKKGLSLKTPNKAQK